MASDRLDPAAVCAGSEVGIVVIGRNEAVRLRAALQSALAACGPVVYVDSGSTDDSLAIAADVGVERIALDPSVPFTAGRARNAGFAHLCRARPDIRFVQFVDGDCELAAGWLEQGRAALEADPRTALVVGRRSERAPGGSLFGRWCALESDYAAGTGAPWGGDCLARVESFRRVGGYRAWLIAGEDPDLSVRLGRAGWRVRRLDQLQTVHAAGRLGPRQWWRRQTRAGYACGLVAALHVGSPNRFWAREALRPWFWLGALPLASLMLGRTAWRAGLATLLVWLLSGGRNYRSRRAAGWSREAALDFSLGCALARLPELAGQLLLLRDLLLGRRTGLIEYAPDRSESRGSDLDPGRRSA